MDLQYLYRMVKAEGAPMTDERKLLIAVLAFGLVAVMVLLLLTEGEYL